ncbi:MAG: regulatory protein RecX [Lysobacter sp.]|nr:regulatory protein RecX [Lysobacter sp.]MDQ3270296.1 recombination regulator RecX [Pseudomonadota bacterium]
MAEETEGAGGGAYARPLRRRRGAAEQSPLQRAVALLSRREHSRTELTRKLCERGIAPDEAGSAVEKLAAEGWQDDARFAQFLLRSRVSGGYGPIRIRAELATHGLDQEAIATALEGFDGEWLQNARDLVARRYGADVAANPALQRKAADFLLRRGFDGECVRRATRLDPER